MSFFHFRRFRFGSVAYLLISVCLGTLVSLPAQINRDTGDREARFEELLDADEARLRLERMRLTRVDGDFRFDFLLEHLPRRDEKTVHAGTMWGSSYLDGSVHRIQLSPPDGFEDNRLIELIVQNGPNGSVWKREHPDKPFYIVEGAALFEPIIQNVLYTPFDLQMPFLYWSDYTYLGATRAMSRVAQEFEMYPPPNSIYRSKGIHAVRIAIDDLYDALLAVEVVDADGIVLSEFKVESLKKVDGVYIVNRIVIKDADTRDRTRFIVEDARVGLILDKAEYFNPNLKTEIKVYGPSLNSKE